MNEKIPNPKYFRNDGDDDDEENEEEEEEGKEKEKNAQAKVLVGSGIMAELKNKDRLKRKYFKIY